MRRLDGASITASDRACSSAAVLASAAIVGSDVVPFVGRTSVRAPLWNGSESAPARTSPSDGVLAWVKAVIHAKRSSLQNCSKAEICDMGETQHRNTTAERQRIRTRSLYEQCKVEIHGSECKASDFL